MTSKIRFGIIGCSRIARKSLLPALDNSSSALLSMIGSRTEKKAKEWAVEFGCDKFGTYDAVLDSEDVDAVYISLPVGLHEEWVLKAAAAGKHVLVEKSSTISLSSAEKMVAACKKKGVRLMEGFMFRYHPQHRKVKDIIAEGNLGDVFEFRGSFGFPFPKEGDIRWDKKLGGGVLNDAACYPIYASRMLFEKEPLGVFCRMKFDPVRDVDIKFDGMLIYSEDMIAYVSSKYGAYFQSTYSLWGTEARLKIARAYAVPKDRKTFLYLDADDKVEELVIGPADHFALMIDNFCSVISGGADFDFESDLVAQAKIMEAARLSAKTGQVIWLADL